MKHPHCARPRVLVVGDVMLDRYVIGEVTRISPEAPVPVLAAKHEENRPGGAANLAANISAMGGNATLLAVVGDDSASAELEECLQRFQVTPLFVNDPQGGTTQKTRLVVGSQQIARVDRDVKITALAQQRMFEEFVRILGDYDVVVLSDYAKGTLDRLPEYLSAASRLGVPTLVDPKRVTPEFYRGAFLLKPNNNEFVGLFGPYATEQELVTMAKAAIKRLDLTHLVITRGAKGMVIVSEGGQASFVPTRARDVFDVSGAGDTVLAALAMELAAGRSIGDAVNRANVAAGIAVSHPGTYVVSEREIDAELNDVTHEHQKVLTSEQLKIALVSPRMRGKKIVFTNGCFDILHPGHVRLLRAARALGDILVLAINSDDSVRRLKGPSRPVNNFSHRAEVLAGLTSVDYIVEFDTPTPLETIQYVLPDVLVKGGDYPVAEIVGYSEVKARGGQVYALDFHSGYSTTRIIDAINNTGRS